MAIDYASLLYGPLYDQNVGFGVAAVLDLGTAGTFDLTVIDKTEGVAIDEGNGLMLSTTKPAAIVRMSELADNSLSRSDLKQATISFNGGDWTIVATQPKPNPNGPGELYLILQEA